MELIPMMQNGFPMNSSHSRTGAKFCRQNWLVSLCHSNQKFYFITFPWWNACIYGRGARPMSGEPNLNWPYQMYYLAAMVVQTEFLRQPDRGFEPKQDKKSNEGSITTPSLPSNFANLNHFRSVNFLCAQSESSSDPSHRKMVQHLLSKH